MTTETAPTNADAESLASKLEKFDASLTPAERAIFRYRLVAGTYGEDDVIGHRLEMRWQQGPGGMFRSWVQVDEDADPNAPLAGLDPSIWTTFSAASTTTSSTQSAADRQAQSPA